MVCKTITQFVAQQCDKYFLFLLCFVFLYKKQTNSLFILVDLFSIEKM